MSAHLQVLKSKSRAAMLDRGAAGVGCVEPKYRLLAARSILLLAVWKI